MVGSRDKRRSELVEVFHEARGCVKCPLSESRTQVVFGAGNADADLMFVGEAPGAEEDRQGLPFVGRSGALLTSMLEHAGIKRDDVFIANTLKCRPPENRDPTAAEIETCRPWLFEQIRLIEPRVVATLGNFATKLLTGDQTGITKVHGKPQVKTLGSRTVFLLPLFHPAAGLRAKGTAELLAADIDALPALLERALPEQP
ncbi:MAG: uracil-DNA glycosylase [Solirubrobacterales bacterium]